MKKIALLTIASSCLFSIANSQITKGSTYLGGSLVASSSSSTNDTLPSNKYSKTSWGLSPQLGKAIADNVIVGIFLNYYSQTDKQTYNNTSGKSTYDGYGGGVFYRRYFPLSQKFFLFGEASVGVSYGIREEKDNAGILWQSKPLSFSAGIAPGISYKASKKLYLETSLNNLLVAYYTRYKSINYNPSGNPSTYTNKEFYLGANANGFRELSIGLRWILPGKTS